MLRGRLPAFVACREPRMLEEATGCPVYPFYTACVARSSSKPPVSYILLGRVAIVSLDERLKGKEREIAEELLRTVPGIEAVYGKVATRGEHRVQELLHLAGARIEKTIYVENGLRIPVPLGRVYANPRLATEHARVAKLVKSEERVLDMFSGVGGFTLNISAAGRAALVVANDKNPYAVEALVEALVLNRRKLKTPIIVLNEDARRLPQLLKPVFTRIVMNLPHGALEFIDTALSLCSKEKGCVVHLYTVARSPQEARQLVADKHPELAGRVTRVSRVLDYAPGKYIFRVDIDLKDDMQGKTPSEG